MGTILPHLGVGELYLRTWLGIVDNIAVDLLLETSYIDRYIRAILPGEQKLVPWHPTPVATIEWHNEWVLSQEETNEHEEPDCSMSAPLTISKRVLITPFTQQVAQTSTSTHGLLNITPISAKKHDSRTEFVAAHGVIDDFHDDRF